MPLRSSCWQNTSEERCELCVLWQRPLRCVGNNTPICGLGGMDVTWWAVAAALAVVLLTVFVLRRGSGSKRGRKLPGDTILFLGNSGTGKSVLFSQLFRSVRPETVSSIEEERLANTQLVSRSSAAGGDGVQKPLHAVCLPGNRKLRTLYKKYLETAAGIVFTIDATAPDIKGTAAFLHELLVNPTVDERCPPILLAITKNDLARKQPGFADFIVKGLEGELEILKRSQNSGVSCLHARCLS